MGSATCYGVCNLVRALQPGTAGLLPRGGRFHSVGSAFQSEKPRLFELISETHYSVVDKTLQQFHVERFQELENEIMYPFFIDSF